jgi:subtilisin family serine protease
MATRYRRWIVLAVAPAAALTGLAPGAGHATAAPAASAAAAPAERGRYLVVARSAADYQALRAKAVSEGATVTQDIPALRTLAIQATSATRGRLAADSRTLGVATDGMRKIHSAERYAPDLDTPGLRSATRVKLPAASPETLRRAGRIDPDPAWDYKGLLWDYRRMGLPQGWSTTTGSPRVKVGVADTGLDFTHADLAAKVKKVVDFTGLENPPVCKTLFGVSDDDLAAELGGPPQTDWSGHGSWIGGNIAAALNRTGTNGIAPRVDLVSLKISQWCGSTTDSTLLAAFVAGADLGLDVISISFGGYQETSTAAGRLIYRQYADAVAYARRKGTLIVASAGNEHVRVGAGGRVLSHGQLAVPGDEAADWPDLFGLYEVPGGIPGVIDVAATGRLVNRPSATCPPGSTGSADPAAPNFNATCKPASDRHQAAGQGRRDQLAFYSNYGPRIDIAAPGGARKFNLPNFDRGGTPGFPYTTADLTNAWQVFSATSNWAVEIPCFTFAAGSGFPEGQCYSTIQGTSMATPHVSAALALIASAHPRLRHRPSALVALLKWQADRDVDNFTRALDPNDRSPGDLSGLPCEFGNCHLGGPRIPDREAYGAGVVDVSRP